MLSSLIWGGLFFLMMRFGCGAHMMGGHGRHGRHDAGSDATRKQAGLLWRFEKRSVGHDTSPEILCFF